MQIPHVVEFVWSNHFWLVCLSTLCPNWSTAKISSVQCNSKEKYTILTTLITIYITRTVQHTYTHPFNCPFSGTTHISWYQKGKTKLDFTEARDSEWHWHQLGHMQVCTSLQTDNHASSPLLSFLQAGCPSCCPTNSVRSLKFNIHCASFNKMYSLVSEIWNVKNLRKWDVYFVVTCIIEVK